MRFSVTERQSYKRCRRKWDYTSYNRQSLAPLVNAPALDLGTLIHETLGQWTVDPSLDPVPLYTELAQQYFQNLIDTYKSRIGCAPSAVELMPTMEAVALGQSMIENYRNHWHTPLPQGFALIATEQSLVVPVPGTEHCTCVNYGCDKCRAAFPDGWLRSKDFCCRCQLDEINSEDCPCVAQHELECTLDGLVADERGDYYILERKTFGRTPSIEELDNNDQFLAYQWALTQAMQVSGGPNNIVGLAYDGLLKKPKPSGVHNTMDKLFLRRVLLRGKYELAEFGQLLAGELTEMANNPPLYKTVPPVQGCQRWECKFLELCHAQSKGQPTRDLLKMFTKVDRKSHLDIPVDVEAV